MGGEKSDDMQDKAEGAMGDRSDADQRIDTAADKANKAADKAKDKVDKAKDMAKEHADKPNE